MERNFFRYIWSHTRKEQVWIMIVTLLAMIPYYLSFDLPKQIINGPITGMGFDNPGDTLPFLRIEMSLPVLGPTVLFPGIDLERMPLLLALSLAFLALVIVNGLMKVYINTFKGQLGERLLRRIRYDLIDRVLRFPPKRFKSVKAGEVASMVKDEVEPFGGFSGEAFASPVMLAGQTLTAMLFIFVQHIGLGFVALAMALIQVLIIPKLRARLLILGRERQLTARKLSGRVAEIVDGIDTIRGSDATNFVRADIVQRLGRIFKIRYDIYQWKFFVKFLNNFIGQLTPFIFYLFGGYLAINGKLDVGQLVAVINAYKELPAPMKGLIDYDLARQDVQVKYETIIGQFDVDQLIEAEQQRVDAEIHPLTGQPLQIRSLNIVDDSGAPTLERASARFESGERVALLASGGGSAAEDLANAIGRFVWPSSGAVQIGSQDLFHMPDAISARQISYASPNEFFFSGSLGDNLLLGVRNAPRAPAPEDPNYKEWVKEANASGNPLLNPADNWIDESALLQRTGARTVEDAIRTVLEVTGAAEEVFQLGMTCPLDPVDDAELVEALLERRAHVSEETALLDAEGLLLRFDFDTYNDALTIGENLFFGSMVEEDAPAKIGEHPFLQEISEVTGLGETLYQAGRAIAETAVYVLGDLPEDHPFYERMTLIPQEDLPGLRALLERTEGVPLDDLEDEDTRKLIWLSAYYNESWYRFGVVHDGLKETIVKARKMIRERLPDELSDLIEFYDEDKYLFHADMRSNIVFGKPNPVKEHVEERLAMVADAMRRKHVGLVDQVMALGMRYDVGPAGRRLSAALRARLSVARALLRSSDIYVFNRPFLGLPQVHQRTAMASVLRYLKEREMPPLIIWVVSNEGDVRLFDRVITFAGPVISADQPASEFVASQAKQRAGA